MVRRLLESIGACTASIVPNVMKWVVIWLLKYSETFRFVTDRKLENWPEKGCRLCFSNFLFAVSFFNQKEKLRWNKKIWMPENEQEFLFFVKAAHIPQQSNRNETLFWMKRIETTEPQHNVRYPECQDQLRQNGVHPNSFPSTLRQNRVTLPATIIMKQ